MPCFTITITDNTQTPQSLLTILTKGATGYAVAGQSTLSGMQLSTLGEVSYLALQASKRNSGGVIVYKGDENVKADGSRQGRELAAGDSDVMQAYSRSVYLGEVFVTASANGAIINGEYHVS